MPPLLPLRPPLPVPSLYTCSASALSTVRWRGQGNRFLLVDIGFCISYILLSCLLRQKVTRGDTSPLETLGASRKNCDGRLSEAGCFFTIFAIAYREVG